ncbi:hypothetical protein COO91_02242 [Nostoc flagelliforme CCNUN1]|uniref:Uncharacterized protein n=1 Tax=Nostoc flagelliforme CCNUN1 TaxID=2038116 RepID=A0A2K8SLU3_9NOSO|nr:hypothetical protein COO91_02242 [Nostoc flagelliforme CCNUN1]
MLPRTPQNCMVNWFSILDMGIACWTERAIIEKILAYFV